MPRERKEPGQATRLADLEGNADAVEAPGLMPPPGVEAAVETKIRYNRTIQPAEDDPRNSQYSDDLRDLATEELDDLPEPETSDPCSEFLSRYQRFSGYYLRVIRLPDPAANLMPGNGFNRSCREITQLGTTTFEPLAFEQSLQILSGNSGGVFRVWLLDVDGTPIPGARLDRVVINDPPKQLRRGPYYDEEETRERFYRPQSQAAPAQPPTPPEKSDFEKRMENLQATLLERALTNAMNPNRPEPQNAMSDNQLAAALIEKGDLLPKLVDRITSLAQAPDKLEQPSTWKDKLGDAAIELVTHNPQLIERTTDLVTRAAYAITNALVAGFGQRQPVNSAPVYQPAPLPPAPQAQPQPRQPQAVNGLPETDQPIDHDLDSDEDEEVDMIEDITKLLMGSDPLSLDDPIVLELREDYPAKFDLALKGIVAMPPQSVLAYIASKSDFAASMISGPVTGPHLRARLMELRALILESDLIPNDVKEKIKAQQAQSGA